MASDNMALPHNEKEPIQSATPTVYERSRHNSDEHKPEDGRSGGVDVTAAKEDFAQLQREASRHSQGNRDVEKQQVCLLYCIAYMSCSPLLFFSHRAMMALTCSTTFARHPKLSVMLAFVIRFGLTLHHLPHMC
jgi:hypothetical protein